MPLLYLVRHGRAAAAWNTDADPGLDDLGREQAARAADSLAPLGPMDLAVSPMARTRETAVPLAGRWGADARIDPRVSEIPSPEQTLEARGRWLRDIAAGTWQQLPPPLQEWRNGILAALSAARRDTVFVTHFMAINIAVGAATNNDRVVSFSPDHCSITVLRLNAGRLSLVQPGLEASTQVL